MIGRHMPQWMDIESNNVLRDKTVLSNALRYC